MMSNSPHPTDADTRDEADDDAPGMAIAMPEEAPRTGPKILVVEDNPVMGQILGKLLARFPVQHDRVANGLEAIEAARETDYALIFMDILMPKLGGVAASKEIRSLSNHYRDVPIIAVTARVSERAVEEYFDEGMSDVVKKPINRLNLATMLKKHLKVDERASNEKEEQSQLDITITEDDLDILNWETLNEYKQLLKNDRFRHFLKEYLKAAPDQLEAINAGIQEGDPAAVQFHAHKFKSTSQVFGAEVVSDLSAKLEIMGKNENIRDADKLFLELHIAYERAQRALTKKLVLLQNM